MDRLIMAPILLPMLTAVLCILTRQHSRLQHACSVIGVSVYAVICVVLLLTTMEHGYLVTQAGGWPAPYGISLVVDLLAAIMVLMTGISGLAVVVYSIVSLPSEARSSAFHPLLHFLLMGVGWAFLTGDMFNLYVSFEIILLSSFCLLTLEGEAEQTEGAVKYVVLNLVASTIFLAALGLLYAKAGTLNMADISLLAQQAVADQRAGPLRLAGLLFMIAFAIKAAMFPFFFWLPASYHTPSVPVSALFAGLLTKVGVYALIRLHTLVMPGDALGHDILLALGVATMILGVLGAAGQMGIRRILAFHIISQIGYMVVGIAIGTPLALAATILFVAHNILAKTNLFLIGGVASDIGGSEDLRKIGGMGLAWPALGLIYWVSALGLAGIPPLSGLVAKFAIISAGVEAEMWWVVGAALATGALTLYSMVKIWIEVFWKDHPDCTVDLQLGHTTRRLMPMMGLAVLTILFGLCAGSLFELSHRAAEQLVNPAGYIAVVLGEQP